MKKVIKYTFLFYFSILNPESNYKTVSTKELTFITNNYINTSISRSK